jgi:hypothetical protein
VLVLVQYFTFVLEFDYYNIQSSSYNFASVACGISNPDWPNIAGFLSALQFAPVVTLDQLITDDPYYLQVEQFRTDKAIQYK